MIPLMKNAFLNEQETKEALCKFIMTSDKFSMGEKCFEFEQKFASFCERKDAVLFNSGGSANLAMLQTLKNLGRLRDGSKIGFSALTWSTNTMPIIQLGMVPVALDCDLRKVNVMSYNLEERLKETNLDAIFITNVLGFAGDLGRIKEICKAKNIIVIEDNCESLGTRLNDNKLTGGYGEMASCSFFVAHHMSTIEGGVALTDDEEIGEMLRIVRANGWDRNLKPTQQQKWRTKFNIQSEFDAKYTFFDLGYNLRPTEITGFLGLFQLQYLKENIAIREKNYLHIESKIRCNDDFIHLEHDHIKVLSNFAFPLVCKTPALRQKYIKRFNDAGIEIRPMIAGNIQRQPFYNKYVKKIYPLPGVEHIDVCGMYFGNYPELTNDDLESIISCF